MLWAVRFGTIALVQEGDSVTIDAAQNLLQLNVSEDELERRRAAWFPEPRYCRGVLATMPNWFPSAAVGLRPIWICFKLVPSRQFPWFANFCC